MICPSCGTENNSNKFCVKCGYKLIDDNATTNASTINSEVAPKQEVSTNNNTVIETAQNLNQPVNNNVAPTNSSSESNNKKSKKIEFKNYYSVILLTILKPFDSYETKIEEVSDIKNSFILPTLVSLCATIITLIKIMFNAVRVTSFLTKETKWVWENLKDIAYVKVIGMNFLLYMVIILAIAGVYYLASLVAKKQVSFSKLLSISSIAIVPMLVCYLVISSLVSIVYGPLGLLSILIGLVYTILIIYELINKEISLEHNKKIYFNLICISILVIIIYYVNMKFFVSQGSGNIDISDILNILGG